MQAKDIMSSQVVTVGPETSAKDVAALMVEHGFAAVPVVDDDNRLVGVVAEADVLRDRLPQDPRLHLRRDKAAAATPPLLVSGIMTTRVRSVDASADIADVASLILDENLRSVPVLDNESLVGIISRRDLLRSIIRTDAAIRADLERLIETYRGESGCWEVRVHEGVATLQRTHTSPGDFPEGEQRILQTLARTVGGVVAVRVLSPEGEDSANHE